MAKREGSHGAHLRPVARDAATGDWQALPLVRSFWEGIKCDAWMLWCTTCRSAVEGTALVNSVDCDIEDLRSRMVEVAEWEQECRAVHQFGFDGA